MSGESLASAILAGLAALWLLACIWVEHRAVRPAIETDADLSVILPWVTARPSRHVIEAAEFYGHARAIGAGDPVTVTLLGYSDLDDPDLGAVARAVLAEHVAADIEALRGVA